MQSGQIRAAAVFIVNFHADIELLGGIVGVGAQLCRIAGKSLVRVFSVTGSSNGHHHSHAAALKVIDDRRIHANGNPVDVARIVGQVHEFDGIDKA